MKKKEINNNNYRINVNIENMYENDYKLMKVISQTKEMTHSNNSLTERKNNLRYLMDKINDEEINDNELEKNLHISNENFHNEYKLFNQRKNKKDTKIIFKDLVKLYKSRGYRIPNFSINEHNIFKINPLLEDNATTISNGLLANHILKKNDESQKTINYLKKLGGILSEKLSNFDFKKNFKKMKIVNLKTISEENSEEALKKQIEILLNLINTNALDKLDEPKKVNYSYSRHNSIKSYKYKSNKKLIYLNNQRYSTKNSKISNKNLHDLYLGRRISTESSGTNRSLLSNKKKKLFIEKYSDNLYKLLNYNNKLSGINISKTPKEIKIPTLNLQKIKQKNSNEVNNINTDSAPSKTKFKSEKINNIFINKLRTPNKNKRLNWTRNTIKDMKMNLMSPFGEINKSRVSAVKNNSYNESSFSDDYYEQNNQTTSKKKNMSNYPYTNKNEFLNYAYNRFSKKGPSNCETYVKTYLNKVKGFNDDKIENFFKSIYDKNFKNNLKELENKIKENDMHLKTERIYLSNHLIKRIKPVLKSMKEKDKVILKLEKIFTHAIINK